LNDGSSKLQKSAALNWGKFQLLHTPLQVWEPSNMTDIVTTGVCGVICSVVCCGALCVVWYVVVCFVQCGMWWCIVCDCDCCCGSI